MREHLHLRAYRERVTRGLRVDANTNPIVCSCIATLEVMGPRMFTMIHPWIKPT